MRQPPENDLVVLNMLNRSGPVWLPSFLATVNPRPWRILLALASAVASLFSSSFSYVLLSSSARSKLSAVSSAASSRAALTASSWMPPPLGYLMPTDIGFARALRDKAATLVQVAKARAAATVEERAKEYLLLVSDFCQPLLATLVLWQRALGAALILVAAQILMLIAHQTAYTIWFYEVQLAERELAAAGDAELRVIDLLCCADCV